MLESCNPFSNIVPVDESFVFRFCTNSVSSIAVKIRRAYETEQILISHDGKLNEPGC